MDRREARVLRVREPPAPRWYQIIWIGGYPRELPITDAGQVGENARAFLPVFPALSGVLTWLGLPWNAASVTIAVLAGLGAALVLHRLMSRFLQPDRALFAVVLFAVAPVSPIMQFGYAEPLGFLWLALALLLLVDRRYGWLVPVLAAWAFTRPGRWPSPSRSGCTGSGGGGSGSAIRSRCANG